MDGVLSAGPMKGTRMAICGFRLRPVKGKRAGKRNFIRVDSGKAPFVIITRTRGRGTCIHIMSNRRRSIDQFSMKKGRVRGKLGKFVCNRENM